MMNLMASVEADAIGAPCLSQPSSRSGFFLQLAAPLISHIHAQSCRRDISFQTQFPAITGDT